MAEQTALDTYYLINNTNRNVTLEFIIGAPGQQSSSFIRLDDDLIEQSHRGSFPERPIGKNKDLNNRTLFISTSITDVADDTNYTEMILRIRGGVVFREYPLTKIVEKQGDTAPYACIIRFKNFDL